MDKVIRSTFKTCKKFVTIVRTSKNTFTSDKDNFKDKRAVVHNLENCTEKFRH